MNLVQWKKPSARRYTLRMLGFMGLYMVVLLSVGWLYHNGRLPDAPWRWVIAALPAIPIFGAIWAIQRFVEEEDDEYLRLLMSRAHSLSTGLTVAACTVWGFLENYGGAPQVGMMWVFPIYAVSLPPAQAFTRWRAGR